MTEKKEVTEKKKLYGNNITQILADIKMSQQELCDISGVSESHMSRIVRGDRPCISTPIAIDISMALGHPVEEVFIRFEPEN